MAMYDIAEDSLASTLDKTRTMHEPSRRFTWFQKSGFVLAMMLVSTLVNFSIYGKNQVKFEQKKEIRAFEEKVSTLVNVSSYGKATVQLSQKKKKQASNDTRFLFYYSHSGFGNQVLGLQRMAQLAFVTNRTLVVPPILPHGKGATDGFFTAYSGRDSGFTCLAVNRSETFRKIAGQDMLVANVTDYEKFPSFFEMIDFDALSNKLGVSFIDLWDFVREEEALVNEHISENRTLPNLDFDGTCQLTERRSPKAVKEYFQEFFGHKRLAVIGSGFIVKTEVLPTRELTSLFERTFYSYPPSEKLSGVLKHFFQKQCLPRDYDAIHIRGEDIMFGEGSKNCSSLNITNRMTGPFNNILNSTTDTFYLASNNPCMIEVMKEYLRDYKTTTLDLLIRQHSDLQEVIDSLRVQRGTALLVIDQFLSSLSNQLFFLKDKIFPFQSTFQKLIKRRHDDPDLRHGFYKNNR